MILDLVATKTKALELSAIPEGKSSPVVVLLPRSNEAKGLAASLSLFHYFRRGGVLFSRGAPKT
jgi:hypothetical protein